ncbi:uncharacterized protein FMAN_14408 [Fusarium mangiferae]|uniref:T6SS Phospholipase effector Tle1-like catalytic domain-containing protein n=1 Tax=Fusarium mangiferae TaxID=192010 RepID=A0A1L7UID8_FUSMA|nr:uncharacterized protein FMAN_14408 [Fusarium mangiferae]CVL07517.1 uncharacterized protein FMAN_14408 [Fusarium mangiferae]
MVELSAPAPVDVTGTAHHIRHAVAVDEHRVKFKPALLAQDIKTVTKKARTPDTDNSRVKAATKDPKKEGTEKEDIREVWFPGLDRLAYRYTLFSGSHGDVGRGWPAIPTGLKVWRRWKYIFGGTKVDNLDEPFQDDDLQMSDMALEWMIRKVEIVGKQHPGCQVNWWHTLDAFKAENVEDRVIKGFMHDTLSLGYGSSFLKVFMLNHIHMSFAISLGRRP